MKGGHDVIDWKGRIFESGNRWRLCKGFPAPIMKNTELPSNVWILPGPSLKRDIRMVVLTCTSRLDSGCRLESKLYISNTEYSPDLFRHNTSISPALLAPGT